MKKKKYTESEFELLSRSYPEGRREALRSKMLREGTLIPDAKNDSKERKAYHDEDELFDGIASELEAEQQTEQHPKEKYPGYHYTPAKPRKPICDEAVEPLTDEEIDEMAADIW